MTIIISRGNGKLVSAPELTQEQRDALWGAIVTAYAQKHPEIFEGNKGENTYEN
ncbi:MAG: hypothetical protein J6Q30_00850 [Oscillospiraceae bacterium]|nr:hypothetical protein [Oscillospiraceae bacterium]